MPYSVYVLYSAGYDKIYIGFTSNLNQRVLSHNELSTKGWTVRYRPWSVVYVEEYLDKRSAMARERYLKSGVGRKFLQYKLIDLGLR